MYPEVVLETSQGNIVLKLNDFTPLHCENFIKLVNEGYYNNLLFHRVIKNFMIQAGDPNSVNAKPSVRLGSGGPNYTIPPEFNPKYYHKRGALASARQGDNVNPKKQSSGSQFYIVVGQKYTKEQLKTLVDRGSHIPFTDEQLQIYSSIGGCPHLDLQYTVFGEVIDGFDTLDKIAISETDANSRPLKDVIIIKAYIKQN
jgi:peptidyl-prolyl cis-trans isomerase B (cyclophilin B)